MKKIMERHIEVGNWCGRLSVLVSKTKKKVVLEFPFLTSNPEEIARNILTSIGGRFDDEERRTI